MGYPKQDSKYPVQRWLETRSNFHPAREDRNHQQGPLVIHNTGVLDRVRPSSWPSIQHVNNRRHVEVHCLCVTLSNDDICRNVQISVVIDSDGQCRIGTEDRAPLEKIGYVLVKEARQLSWKRLTCRMSPWIEASKAMCSCKSRSLTWPRMESSLIQDAFVTTEPHFCRTV